MAPIPQRLERLGAELAARGYDALVSDAPADIRYFTGCPDVGGVLVVHRAGAWLLTSAHDGPEARAGVEGAEVEIWTPGEDPVVHLARRLRGSATRQLAVASLPAATFVALSDAMSHATWHVAPDLAWSLRRVKEADELRTMRAAARIVEAGMAAARAALRPGVREIEVAVAAEDAMRRLGSDGRVFETKVESGRRSAWPSTYASEKSIEAGDLVLIDIGPAYRGYYGDLTRTFSIGEPNPERRRLLELVLAAQRAALDTVRAGATGHAVDAAARDVFRAAGRGDDFLHHTGHTLGLAGDARPLLAPHQATPLLAGECVTVEPGVYVSGVGGARIEDEVLVTAGGHELLSDFAKDLDSLVIPA